MNIKPEERPKAIALGIATVIVLMFVIFNTISRLNAAKPSASNTSTASSDAPGTGAADATTAVDAVTPSNVASVPQSGIPGALNPTGAPGTVSPGVGTDLAGTKQDLTAALQTPPVTRDPFTPIAPTGIGEPVTPTFVQQPMRPRNVVTNTYVPYNTNLNRTQPAYNPNLNRMAPGNNIATTPQPPAIPQPETTLAGVIAGPSAVAVLHIGDRGYEVMAGDRLPNDLALTRVTENGVYVKRGQNKWFIAIGKTLSSAMPIKVNEGRNKPNRTLRATMPSPARESIATRRIGPVLQTVYTGMDR